MTEISRVRELAQYHFLGAGPSRACQEQQIRCAAKKRLASGYSESNKKMRTSCKLLWQVQGTLIIPSMIFFICILLSVVEVGAVNQIKGVGSRTYGKHVRFYCNMRIAGSTEKIWVGTYETKEQAALACDVVSYYTGRPSREFNFLNSDMIIGFFCKPISSYQTLNEWSQMKVFLKFEANYLVRTLYPSVERSVRERPYFTLSDTVAQTPRSPRADARADVRTVEMDKDRRLASQGVDSSDEDKIFGDEIFSIISDMDFHWDEVVPPTDPCDTLGDVDFQWDDVMPSVDPSDILRDMDFHRDEVLTPSHPTDIMFSRSTEPCNDEHLQSPQQGSDVANYPVVLEGETPGETVDSIQQEMAQRPNVDMIIQSLRAQESLLRERLQTPHCNEADKSSTLIDVQIMKQKVFRLVKSLQAQRSFWLIFFLQFSLPAILSNFETKAFAGDKDVHGHEEIIVTKKRIRSASETNLLENRKRMRSAPKRMRSASDANEKLIIWKKQKVQHSSMNEVSEGLDKFESFSNHQTKKQKQKCFQRELLECVDTLLYGNTGARESTTVAVFILSQLEENRVAIAELALPALISQLKDTNTVAMDYAATTICNLVICGKQDALFTLNGDCAIQDFGEFSCDGVSGLNMSYEALLRSRSHEETVYRVQQAGVVPILVGFLKSECKETKHIALKTLSRLSRLSPHFWDDIRRSNVIDGLISILKSGECEDKKIIVSIFCRLCGDRGDIFYPEENSGVFIEIVNRLKDELPQENNRFLAFFHWLCGTNSKDVKITKEIATWIITTVIQGNLLWGISSIAWCFRTFAAELEIGDMLVKAGGIPFLIDILENGATDGVADSAKYATLQCLSIIYDINEVRPNGLPDSNLIPPLVKLLTTKNYGVMTLAARCLFLIFLEQEIYLQKTLEAGAMPHLVNIINNAKVDNIPFADALREDAVYCIYCLLKEDGGRISLYNCNAISCLVHLLQNGTFCAKARATWCLVRLCENMEFQSLVRNCGTIPHLIQLLDVREIESELQEIFNAKTGALMCLKCLVSMDEYIAIFQRFEGMNAFCELIVVSKHEPPMLSKIAWALANLAQHIELRCIISKSEVLNLLRIVLDFYHPTRGRYKSSQPFFLNKTRYNIERCLHMFK